MAALASLETDQVMVTAVLDTIAGALDLFNELFLSNTVVQNALSTPHLDIGRGTAADPLVQSAIGAYLTSETDAELAVGVVSLLANPLVRDAGRTTIGRNHRLPDLPGIQRGTDRCGEPNGRSGLVGD